MVQADIAGPQSTATPSVWRRMVLSTSCAQPGTWGITLGHTMSRRYALLSQYVQMT